MLLRRVLSVSLLVLSPAVYADALDVNLRDDAAQFKFFTSAGIFIQGNSEFNVGFLYTDSKSNLANATLLVKAAEEAVPGLSIGIGVEGVYGTLNNDTMKKDGAAIAIGTEIGYTLPTMNQVAIIGDLFLSPKITSFANIDRFTQAGLRVEYSLSPQTSAYLGYRQIDFGIKNANTQTLDSGVMLGVKLSF
ncbi:MAG: YfaZ family outer membrane protein [Gallionellaceae bacterium]